jgi:type IV pilus assembly protein PilM
MAVTVGLDIGSTGVRAAVVDTSKSKNMVRRFAEMPLPQGAVVSGEILDESAVGEAISALWKRAKLPKKRVVVGTANQRLVVRQVDVPQMADQELAEALRFQVQDSIPIAVEDAVLDFVPLETFTTPDGEPMSSILVIAVHRDIVDSLLRVTQPAGLSVLAVDLQAFGLVRSAFGIVPAIGNPVQAIVDIGASITQVVIARGGVARFVRILPRGGEDFSTALIDGLTLDPEDAEELKRRVGVAAEGTPEGTSDDDVARRLMTRQADGLIEEIRGSVNFFVSSEEDATLERLVVAGNGARLPHLANRMGRALGLSIQPAKILDHVEIGKVQLSDEEMLNAQPLLPTSVGLALWGLET